jgi:hypothetical protein
MRRAIQVAAGFKAMARDPVATMNAGRRQQLDGTLEAIEKVLFAGEADFKRSRAFMAAEVAVINHGAPLSFTPASIPTESRLDENRLKRRKSQYGARPN